MKSKTLIQLLVAAAAAAAVAWWLTRDDAGSDSRTGGDSTPADFQVSAVARIEIRSAGQSATLVAKDGRWQVVERNGFSAGLQKLASLLRALRNLRGVQTVSVADDQLARLDLLDPGDAEDGRGSGIKVVLADDEGTALAEWIIGAMLDPQPGSGTMQSGRYFRVPGSQPMLTDQSLRNITADPAEWLSKSLVMPDLDVRKVTLTPSAEGADGWTIAAVEQPASDAQPADTANAASANRQPADDPASNGAEPAPTPTPTPTPTPEPEPEFEFTGLAEGESVPAGDIDELVRMLERLRFEDVRALDGGADGFQSRATAEVVSADGTLFELTIGEPEDEMTPLLVTTTPGAEADGTPDAGSATSDDVIYLVPNWSLGQLAKPRSEWIETGDDNPDAPESTAQP